MSSDDVTRTNSTSSSVNQHSENSSLSSTMDLAGFMGLESDAEAGVLPAAQAEPSLPNSSRTPSHTTTSNNNAGGSQINYALPMNQRLGALLEQGAFADVKFKVGPEQIEVSAHKLILAVSSPVFCSMFYSDLESHDVIQLPDCTPDAFQCLLQYIYTGIIKNLDANQAIKVLYSARKYAIVGLEDVCLVTLSGGVCSDNVFEILQVGRMFDLPALQTVCWEYIEEKTKEVMLLHLAQLDFSMLSLILQNDKINISETDLFEMFVNWSELECINQNIEPTLENKREILRPGLHYIRFPTMAASQFADKVVPTKILNVDQVAEILTYISASSQNKPTLQTFNANPRIPKLMKKPHGKGNGQTIFQYYGNGHGQATTTVENEWTPSRRNRRARRNARQWS